MSKPLIIGRENSFLAHFIKSSDKNILVALQNLNNLSFAPPAISINNFYFNLVAVERTAQIFCRNKYVRAAVFGRNKAEAFNIYAQFADNTANFAVASAVMTPSAVSTVERIVIIFFR